METRRRRKDGTNISTASTKSTLDENTSNTRKYKLLTLDESLSNTGLQRPVSLDGNISNNGKHKPMGQTLDGAILSTGRYYIDEPRAPRTELTDRPAIGSSCRDCINFYYGVQLSKSDCRYSINSDGHRRLGVCAYCGKTRPIVEGLTMSGKMKTIGKKI